MITKIKEKEKAIKLRRQGKTYSEILSIIPVAKSTLSIWLQSVNLSKKQKQRITKEKLNGSKRGGEEKKRLRIERQNKIFLEANKEISSISKQELFIIGVILYWSEGTKEKEYHPGSPFQFSNMDPRIIRIILIWLLKVCKIERNMLIFNIFLHESHKGRLEEVKQYWSGITGFSQDNFSTIYWKKNKLNTSRRNIEEKYYGVLKIKVRESSSLVRKIAAWSDIIFRKINNLK
jgi:hypothetical protein